jgi:hypothetical protein
MMQTIERNVSMREKSAAHDDAVLAEKKNNRAKLSGQNFLPNDQWKVIQCDDNFNDNELV